jgi:anti-anti-sigma factor
MESIERKIENYAVVFNVNLVRATLNEAVEFKDYLAETFLETDKDIIVNLSACEHLDSTFLGVLVSGYKKLKSQNRNLVIIEPVDQSSIFLTLNSIGKIFPLYTSVKVALEDIENKKLIEKEINELGHEPKKLSLKNGNKPEVNSPIESIQQEVNENEFKAETLEDNENQESHENNPILENDISGTEELNLIEHDHNEVELETESNFNTDESVVENNTSDLELNEITKSSNFTIRHQNATEKSHFGNGNVKWEFGFN